MVDLEDVRADHDPGGQLPAVLEVLVGAHLFPGGQVLDGGDARLARFGQHRADFHQALLEGLGRDHVLDQGERRAAQDAGRPSVRILFDGTARRRGRAFVDAGEFQRAAVGEIHAAIEATE